MKKNSKAAIPKKNAAPKKASPKKAKAAATKKAASKSATGIKYEDKSAGQPQLVPIFTKIRDMLVKYGKGSVKQRGGEGGQVVLVSEKPVVIQGKKRDELWVGGLLVQKGYVGFYFMPAQNAAEKKEIFKTELLKCLKGKSCFHIKKEDPVIFEQIEQALRLGFQKYKERGWIE